MFRSSISSMQKPYQAVVVEGKWKSLDEFFDSDEAIYNILYPMMTVAKDSAFHIAVHSKSEKPLKQLLDRFANHDEADEQILTTILNTANAYENTVLHEAAINHNIKAVKLLVEGRPVTPDQPERGYVTPDQLLEQNESGQTPLFKAAAFGSTKVVKYLASRPYQTIASAVHKKLRYAHRFNNDECSILHAAVLGENFGTALELLKLDEGLAYIEDKNSMTSLHLLANLQSAFTDKYSNDLWHRLLYFCIPIGADNYDDANNYDDDDEIGDNQSINAPPQLTIRGKGVLSTFQHLCTIISAALETFNKSFWKYFIGDGKWPIVRKIWKEKRKQKFAFMLARKLIKNDDSWEISYAEDTSKYYKRHILGQNELDDPTMKQLPAANRQTNQGDTQEVETPLLAATRTGVISIVKEILDMHPQAVDHVSLKKQNILHVAASYRRREIFELVKQMEIPTRRLIMGIDEDGYTVLHHVADTTNCPGGTRPGPAYQLQEELEWFQMVEEIMPSYLTQHLNKRNHTAQELFKEKHIVQHKEAQQWIKETSQSCSGVAVLVATVVFAAAFTVPGGTRDDNGLPILLHTPFFMFFTVMDVVSLSCSLTAVVMFLSIITSPFELDNFRVSLPRRLTLGFALLFMSVATTMLAFTSTIFLIIRSEHRRRWTLTLICSAAFVPVSVLALTNFPLSASFIKAWNNIFKFIWMAFPSNLLLKILKFLWHYIKELGLGPLKFLHKLVVRFGLYIKELGIGFLEIGIYFKELGLGFLKFLHKLVNQHGFRFLKFLHYLVRRDLPSKDEGNA